MTPELFGPSAAAFVVGLSLAGAPGPVQAVIVSEATRGGLRRGFAALLGSSAVFLTMLVLVAAGIGLATPRGGVLTVTKVVGGCVLVRIAYDGWRAPSRLERPDAHTGASSVVRGMLSVAANPGAWLFLGAVAGPLLASARTTAGTAGGLLVALTLAGGAATGDSILVVAGGVGLPRLGDRTRCGIMRALNVILAALGLWMVADGAIAAISSAVAQRGT
jgi:threonine/homoserine/homoserine lactone efflux protein